MPKKLRMPRKSFQREKGQNDTLLKTIHWMGKTPSEPLLLFSKPKRSSLRWRLFAILVTVKKIQYRLLAKIMWFLRSMQSIVLELMRLAQRTWLFEKIAMEKMWIWKSQILIFNCTIDQRAFFDVGRCDLAEWMLFRFSFSKL